LMLLTNRVADAEQYLQALARLQPTSHGLTLADYYLAQGRQADSERVLRSLAADDTIATPVSLRFAALRLAQGRVQEADETIDAMLLREPRNPSVLLAKAQALLARRHVADAMAKARAATEADPHDVRAHYMLGTLYMQANEPNPAITAFREVLQINPRAVSAQVELAKLYLAI